MNWINIKDQLPKVNQRTLVIYRDGNVELMTFEGVTHDTRKPTWIEYLDTGDSCIRCAEIKFWMPLPEHPKVESITGS